MVNSKKKRIEYFWTEIRRLKGQINKQFIGFVFPRFEEFAEKIEKINNGKHGITNHYYIEKINFGYREEFTDYRYYYYSSLENANFTNAIFLDTADFSKTLLRDVTNFTNTIFEKDILFSWETLQNITFDNVQFKQDRCFDNSQINNCKFINTMFENKISFSESSFSSVSFENSTFEKETTFVDV